MAEKRGVSTFQHKAAFVGIPELTITKPPGFPVAIVKRIDVD
jgi:hypothetical protein